MCLHKNYTAFLYKYQDFTDFLALYFVKEPAKLKLKLKFYFYVLQLLH